MERLNCRGGWQSARFIIGGTIAFIIGGTIAIVPYSIRIYLGGIYMQPLTYFFFEGCPYCSAADRWLKSIISEHPEYADIEINKIDERKQPEIANRYDYYNVPTFYLGNEKLHEGAATRTRIEAVLARAYSEAAQVG